MSSSVGFQKRRLETRNPNQLNSSTPCKILCKEIEFEITEKDNWKFTVHCFLHTELVGRYVHPSILGLKILLQTQKRS